MIQKILEKYRLRKYNSKLDDIKQDIKELEKLEKCIKNKFEALKYIGKGNFKPQTSQTNDYNYLKDNLPKYERKIYNFKSKYARWYKNCLKLNSPYEWENKHQDLYTPTIQRHLKLLEEFKLNLEEKEDYFNLKPREEHYKMMTT